MTHLAIHRSMVCQPQDQLVLLKDHEQLEDHDEPGVGELAAARGDCHSLDGSLRVDRPVEVSLEQVVEPLRLPLPEVIETSNGLAREFASSAQASGRDLHQQSASTPGV